VGEWLPEPILTDEHEDPEQQAEMADSASVAMLVSLEGLSCTTCGHVAQSVRLQYEEIARIIGKDEDSVRQFATRAKYHVERRRPRFRH
jgi:RNA polymerase sigma-70 factor (ECF subfamily)